MDEIQVPELFLCPISYEIMRDPVIVSSGITYDRHTIEKWLFSATNTNTTCPVTKQDISAFDLTPNHTLRRFIQSWCTLNADYGIERIPTPKPPATRSQITRLLDDAKSPPKQLNCLRRLRSIAAESATNKRCIESAGAIEFLAGIVSDFENNSDAGINEEALAILHNLQLSESGLKYLVSRRNGEFVESLTRIMKCCGSYYESRAYSLFLLKSMLEIAEPLQLISLKPQLFSEIVRVLKDEISPQATKAALKLMVNVLPWGRNRVKAVDAGAVTLLIEQLLDLPADRRRCEMMLTALDMMCGCAEGRAELVGHAAGLAVVSKKILRVSRLASERAVRILLSIAKFSGSMAVVQEMAQVGAVAKLCLVLQVEDGKMKERAREVLKLHARVWKNSPCVPRDLISSFPA